MNMISPFATVPSGSSIMPGRTNAELYEQTIRNLSAEDIALVENQKPTLFERLKIAHSFKLKAARDLFHGMHRFINAPVPHVSV